MEISKNTSSSNTPGRRQAVPGSPWSGLPPLIASDPPTLLPAVMLQPTTQLVLSHNPVLYFSPPLFCTCCCLSPRHQLPSLVQMVTSELFLKTNSDQQMVLEQLNIHMQRENSDPSLTITDLKVKHKTSKL